MTMKYNVKTRLIILLLLFSGLTVALNAQGALETITGTVSDAATGQPLAQVSVSVPATGVTFRTDEQGAFSINVPDLEAELSFYLPGYKRRNTFLHGKKEVTISLVSDEFRSIDDSYNSPLGPVSLKDNPFPISTLIEKDLDQGNTTSFDQELKGKVPGLSVIETSGIPGHRTYMNIRGYSSLFAQSQPLLFIDGMIHEHAYADRSLIEGFGLNAFDVLDIEDISDITVLRGGNSYLGSLSSNGVININTEQKAEASTVIKVAAQGGLTFVPNSLALMDAAQYKTYFTEMLGEQGYDGTQIDAMYPWLNGDATATDYYRYNNNTDWQSQVYSPASLYKAYIFIKGGDDIATYNISTGFTGKNGIYDNSKYTRFNLRINGKVNITDKFSVTPNVKLGLGETNLANQGYSVWKNPVISATLKSPLMSPIAKDEDNGKDLNYLDDVGVLGVSNPLAITQNATGVNRNYHFLSSLRAGYHINNHFDLHTIIGINFNNARESIFLPNLGLVQVDSFYNSPGVSVTEYRSFQNHTELTYNNRSANGHDIIANAGVRVMENSYLYLQSIDLNTPSDDFKNLGDGSQYSFLRSTIGNKREVAWVSYYGDIKYSYRDKYLVSSSLSLDGSSVTNKNNRYNFFPSLGVAWRLSSEDFMSNATWIDDFKARASFGVTGNMFTSIYDYSKMYYAERRINSDGVLSREAIPNDELELEKKNTIDAGIDLSILGQSFNLHADYFMAFVNNLIIQQELPEYYGYNIYFDNGGSLDISGFELGLDYRVQAGSLLWTLGATVSKAATSVSNLDFIKEGTDRIVTSVPGGAEYVTMKGQPINAFYGYKTKGILTADEAAAGIIGPKGVPMKAGDIKFIDKVADGVIDEKDMTVIGDPNPDLFGGFFTALAIKNFELSADFTYSMGNDVFNYLRSKTEAMDSYANQSTTVLDHWTTANNGAKLPRLSYGDPTGNTVFSDRWIEDGSYLRLSRLTLSYKISSVGAGFQGATLYVTGTNLLTLTKYTGYDPEFMYSNNPFYMGIDYGMLPQTRSVIVGIKLDL